MTLDQLRRYQIEGLIDRHRGALLQSMRLRAVLLSDKDLVEVMIRRELKARQAGMADTRLVSKSGAYEATWRDLARLAIALIGGPR